MGDAHPAGHEHAAGDPHSAGDGRAAGAASAGRSISAPGIMTLFEARNGAIWVGTHGGGANILDPLTRQVRQLPCDPSQPGGTGFPHVSAFAEDSHGNVWIGTDGGGLNLARPDGTVVQSFRHDPSNRQSLPANTVFTITVRLRRAVHDGILQLHFQPKFRLSDNRIVGVEALLRWCDAEHGDISPARFIEIAEDSGLIIDIGSWVVRAACRHLRKWMDSGYVIPIAINVSAKELLHGDPAKVVETEAAAAGVPASLIEIEITESLLAKDSTTVQSALERLRQLGCKIALDDFGTGYSSLAYITRFPPNRIKIDKAFVRNVDRSPSDAAIANAILSLGASLNLTVTAEGVEREGQLEWLRSRGCDEVQGFLLASPLSALDLEERFLKGISPQSPPLPQCAET